MLLDNKTIRNLINDSKKKEQGRSHLLLHETTKDWIQQIAFCIQPSTLIDVHKHREGTETIICLRGAMAVTFFNEDEMEIYRLDSNNPVLKFNPMQWHTYTSLVEDTIGLEIKEGPFLENNFIKDENKNIKHERIDINRTILKKVEELYE